MISMRNLAISISLAVLSAAPLINAQDVKSTQARLNIQPVSWIREQPLPSQRVLTSWLRTDPVSAPLVDPPDLSTYRGVQLGMNLPMVAKVADMEPSRARVIHQRPAMIQELDWRPSRSLDSLPPADPVKEVLLSFYNSALFRMVVIYDRYKTEELTDQDMVEAISARYGTASRPDATVILFSTFQVYDDSEKVIARWENAQYSFNLFRSSYQPTFGMLIFSKRLDILAQEAIAEAIRLDEQEDPQREIERQKIQGEANQAAQEKARLANKTNFRP
ncbi:MAG: hypothetical protein ABSA59_02805 [Terriglobia bacterium]|jgi:hypothetical protein